jgi:hypothetical protein
MIKLHQDVDGCVAQVSGLLCVSDRRQALDCIVNLGHRRIVHLF